MNNLNNPASVDKNLWVPCFKKSVDTNNIQVQEAFESIKQVNFNQLLFKLYRYNSK